MDEMQSLRAEVERLRSIVHALFPYVRNAPASVLDTQEEEMRGGPGWRLRVAEAYARRFAS